MKKWNFKVNSNPHAIIEKLDSTLQSMGGFVFKSDSAQNNGVVFNFRKRVKYPDQILHRNRIVVDGKILKLDRDNAPDVEIQFRQHIFMSLTVLSIVVSAIGFIAFISRLTSGATMYLLGAIVLVVGTMLWFALQKKFEKDVNEYKTLISGILES